MKRILYTMRINAKYAALRLLLPVRSFCKNCGHSVRDFHVEDDLWAKVRPTITRGNTLCFECFCEAAKKVGIRGIPTIHFPK